MAINSAHLFAVIEAIPFVC